MMILSKIMQTVSKPVRTPEEWRANDALVAEFDAERERERIARRIENAYIPKRYLEADLKLCDRVSREWAKHLGTGMLLQGRCGRGKTYTACSLLLALAPVHTIRFSTFADVVLECRATFDSMGTEREVIAHYGNIGVLVLDDLGKERPTEYSSKVLWQIIDKRYCTLKPTIVTSQYFGQDFLSRLAPDNCMETASAIASRMLEYTNVKLTGTDRRLQ